MIRKSFDLTIKANDLASGTFSGSASVYNVIDLHGDVIVPGAFDTTLKQKGDTRPLLWQHDMADPIGTSKFGDSESALLVEEGKLVAGVRQAEEAGRLVDAGAVTGLSIGFDILRESWDGGVRIIEEIDLWEVSLVTFPANPLARVAKMADANTVLQELKARHTKAGRVLSSANLSLVEDAIEALTKLRDAAVKESDEDTKDSGAPASEEGIKPASVEEIEAAETLSAFLDEIRSYSRGA